MLHRGDTSPGASALQFSPVMKDAIRGPSWKQESPFSWYSHSWINYNYRQLNLGLKRKQAFGRRYVNATSRSIATAQGTNLFSDTQTNFLLIRAAHRVSFSYLLRQTSGAFCTKIMGYVKKVVLSFCARRGILGSINELPWPTNGLTVQSTVCSKSKATDSEEAQLVSDEHVALVPSWEWITLYALIYSYDQ